MRRTLVPGLLEVLAHNARLRDRLCFFEIGPVFLPGGAEGLPAEPRRVAIGMAGRVATASWRETDPPRLEFFDLKGVIEGLLQGLHLSEVQFEPASHPTFAPGRCARLVLGGRPVGLFGEVHPKVQAAFDLAGGPICVAELDLEVTLELVGPTHAVSAVPRFPPALQDIALVVDETVPATELTSAIRAAGSALLADVRLFDVYRGRQVAPGKKSLAFSLVFQAADRTLTDAEVEAEKQRIVEALSRRAGAQLRT